MVYTPSSASPGLETEQAVVQAGAASLKDYKAALRGTPVGVCWDTGLLEQLGPQSLAKKLHLELPPNSQYINSIDGPPRRVNFIVRTDYSKRGRGEVSKASTGEKVVLKTCLQYPTTAFNRDFPEGKKVWSNYTSPATSFHGIPSHVVEMWHIKNGQYFDSPVKSDFNVRSTSHAMCDAFLMQPVHPRTRVKRFPAVTVVKAVLCSLTQSSAAGSLFL
jgi:hypothetical protein